MENETRRGFLGGVAAMAAVFTGGTKLLAQQAAPGGAPGTTPAGAQAPDPATIAGMGQRRGGSNHVANGIFYFSGTGANDGYPKDDHVLVTRTMDALKRSVERAGSNMDSLLHLDVFICLPHADGIPMPTGKARFDAHKAQYDALNKIYGTYFSPGKNPSRACMAVEWIPGDSLIEIVGTALVVGPPAPQGEK